MIKKILEKYQYYHHFIPNVLIENQHYLMPGLYRLDTYGELVNHCGDKSTITNSLWGIKALNWHKRIVRRLMVKLFSKDILSNGGELFSGKTLKYSEDGIIKIFDFDEKLVLSVMPTNQKSFILKENHDYFSKYFHTTNIKLMKSNVFTEDYIEPDVIEANQKFDVLLECYNQYFKQLKSYGRLNTDYQILNLELEDNAYRLSETIILRCHGDCWSSNILYSNRDLYMIDFDRNGQFFFLYDIMTYMYCEAVFNHDSLIIDNFITGRYDKHIAEFYNTFELKWTGSKKTIVLQFRDVYFKEHLKLSKNKEQINFIDFIENILTLL